jgi:hypothetical protein
LLNCNWSKKIGKKVQHIHILGNSSRMKIEKVINVNRWAVNIPKNEKFEIIK